MKIDHIGYAVRDIEKAKSAFEFLGYTFGETTQDLMRNVAIAFGQHGGCRVELVARIDTDRSSAVDTYLSEIGPTPYHLCYASDDMEADLAALRQNAFKLLNPPTPAPAFGGKCVAFLYHLGVGLVEVVER